ncbi:hypothetical protein DTO282E5_2829 [Paecilomyces variotii]|nr:hypothetical protein DTO282E5_2829 [Paecilomyces variotii]
MGFRIVTWNVNGIRNPFGYQPWRDKRTFEAMFDVLEADVVVFEETKIQRKDLRDDMVLVSGWDCYFSLPKIKKGYSGVVIYTRNATCTPVRAEEGVTGILNRPGSSTPYRDLPEDQQIGGYPTAEQLSEYEVDAASLDSEGRCVVLEFPAFVLLGVYCPANRDETRDGFRLSFLNALDSRIRNLVASGKRVVLTGDINISRAEIDAAHATEAIRKQKLTEDEFVSSPARRIFNQLVLDGKVIGPRDEGREKPVLYDICRAFHPDRRGMYTCWEQKINARPGNYGSRIDYVLCSLDMKDWFFSADIQPGLMGSDHCPVYAVLKDVVPFGGTDVDIRDIMNPPGTFVNGKRQREYSTRDQLPLSGRLIPEFDRRRSIKDMFSRRAPASGGRSPVSLPPQPSQDPINKTVPPPAAQHNLDSAGVPKDWITSSSSQRLPKRDASPPAGNVDTAGFRPVKRSKSATGAAPGASTKSQQSLRGYFKSRRDETEATVTRPSLLRASTGIANSVELKDGPSTKTSAVPLETSTCATSSDKTSSEATAIIDPVVSKECWAKLFNKKPPPKCEDHQEPCISMVTKKPGINRGRMFWMCPRPLGPSGTKEKGTQWRCSTFIWASDWNSPD